MSRRMEKRDRSRSSSIESDRPQRRSRFSDGNIGGGGGDSGNRKVTVSNIAFNTTFQELREEFNKVGEVTFVQLLKDESTKKFKGRAVVTFNSYDGVREAIQTMNRKEFKGRLLVVKEGGDQGNDRGGQNDRKRTRNDGDGGLSRSSMGGSYGSGMNTMGGMNSMSNMSSLSGINSMSSMNSMNNINSMSGMNSMSNISTMSNMNTMTGMSTMNAIPNQSPANFNTYGLSMPFLDALKIDLPLVSTVFVANLDYDVQEKDLKELFAIAGKVNECELFKGKDGKSRGLGIVDYEHPVEAVQAISMLNNQTYRDRTLTVRMDRSDRKRDKQPRLPEGLKSIGMGLGDSGAPLKDVRSLPTVNTPTVATPQINNMSLMGNVGNPVVGSTQSLASNLGLMDPMANRMGGGALPLTQSLGLNTSYSSQQQQSQQQLHQQPPPQQQNDSGLGNIVHITNLPLDYNNDNLRKLCWSCGEVRLAEMRSHGSGMVKFRTEPEARRTVEMLDNRPLEGRILTARLL